MNTRSTRIGGVVAWVAAAALLAACGGGSSGGGSSGGGGDGGTGSGSGSGSGGSTSIAVTGTAGKGLLGNAVVTVYDVSANGTIGTTVLATSRTNDRGVYSATINTKGPVVIRVTTDAQSTMLDELSGKVGPAPAGLTLHTAVSGLAAGSTVAITPLTEMAYGLASAASGGLTAANIDSSNSLVSTALLDGAPIVATQPIDLANFKTATVAEQAQAKLLTALMVSANEGSATNAAGAPCADNEYHARITCMVGGLKSLLTPGAGNSAAFAPQAAYLTAAYEKINLGLVAVQGAQSPSAVGLSTETTAEKSLMAAVGEKAILLGYDASASPLVNTKALFADLRTNIAQVEAGEDIFGISPTVEALEADFSSNVAPVLENTRAVLVAAYTAAELLEAAEAGRYEDAAGQVVCGYDPAGLATAANVAVCRFGEQWDEQVRLTATRSEAGIYAIATQPMNFVEHVGNPVPGNEQNPIYDPWGSGFFEADDSKASLAAEFTLRSGGASGAARSATWKGPYYVTQGGGQVRGDLSAAQSDDWDPATLSGTLRIGGALSDGAGGIELTEATIGEGSEIVIRNGALTPGIAPEVYGELNLARLATDAFVYSIRAAIARPELDASGTVGVPKSVSVVGAISRIGAGGATSPVFSGEIDVSTQGIGAFDVTKPISADNAFVAQAKVIGRLSMPNGRSLAVSVAANGSRLEATPDAPHSLSITYAYTTPLGMARIHIDGKYDETNGYSAIVTTNTGVTANLTRTIAGKLTGTVTARGEATATIAGTTISYSDGSTESIY